MIYITMPNPGAESEVQKNGLTTRRSEDSNVAALVSVFPRGGQESGKVAVAMASNSTNLSKEAVVHEPQSWQSTRRFPVSSQVRMAVRRI